MITREIGAIHIFNYPDFGTPSAYPDHVEHRGQFVRVIRHEGRSADNELECGDCMYRVRAGDGWEGFAWASELEGAVA